MRTDDFNYDNWEQGLKVYMQFRTYNCQQLWRVGKKEEFTMTTKVYLGDNVHKREEKIWDVEDNFGLKYFEFVELHVAFSGYGNGKTWEYM